VKKKNEFPPEIVIRAKGMPKREKKAAREAMYPRRPGRGSMWGLEKSKGPPTKRIHMEKSECRGKFTLHFKRPDSCTEMQKHNRTEHR